MSQTCATLTSRPAHFLPDTDRTQALWTFRCTLSWWPKPERGREFLDRIRAARQVLADAQVSIPFPDVPGSLTFNGEAMLIAADIPRTSSSAIPARRTSATS